MAANLFEYLNAMSHTKVHNMKGTENDAMAEKDYDGFMTNRAFSLHADSILFANEANKFTDIDKLMQYDFYFYGLRAKKRFSKWPKKEKLEELEVVKKAFGYNNKHAREALAILTHQQINSLKQKQETGGQS